MPICKATRLHEGVYEHQCPTCGRWNPYGMWGVAHDYLDLDWPSCACGVVYRVERFGCERADAVAQDPVKPLGH